MLNKIINLFKPSEKIRSEFIKNKIKEYLRQIEPGNIVKINPLLNSEARKLSIDIESVYVKDGKLRAEIRLTSVEFYNLLKGQAELEVDESVEFLEKIVESDFTYDDVKPRIQIGLPKEALNVDQT